MTPELILNIICEKLELDKDKLIGTTKIDKKSKPFKYIDGRYLAAYFLRKNFKITYQNIGLMLGRSHASIIYGEQMTNDFLKGRIKDFDNTFLNSFKKVESAIINEFNTNYIHRK